MKEEKQDDVEHKKPSIQRTTSKEVNRDMWDLMQQKKLYQLI